MAQIKRLEWIDRMRGLAMLSVVIQHLSFCYINNFVYYKLIAISNLAVFFFISAYLMERTANITTVKDGLIFLFKKTIQLMLPFFVWLLIIPNYFFQPQWTTITIDEIINQFENPGQVGFLLTLYGYCFLFVICKITKQVKFEWIIWILLFIIIFFCNYKWGFFHNATLYLPYFIAGILSSRISNIEKFLKNGVLTSVSFLCIVLMLPFWTSGATSIVNITTKLLIAPATIIITYNCCTQLSWNKYFNQFILMCGKYSLAIYVTHWTFLKITETKFTIIQNELIAFIPIFLYASLICFACVLIKKIISLCPIIDCLMYGNYKLFKFLKK